MKYIKVSFPDIDFENCLRFAFSALTNQRLFSYDELTEHQFTSALATLADGFQQSINILRGDGGESHFAYIASKLKVEITVNVPHPNICDVQMLFHPNIGLILVSPEDKNDTNSEAVL